MNDHLVPLPTPHGNTRLSLTHDLFYQIIQRISSGEHIQCNGGSIVHLCLALDIPVSSFNRWVRLGQQCISHPETVNNHTNPLHAQLVVEMNSAHVELGSRIVDKLNEILLNGETTTYKYYTVDGISDEFGFVTQQKRLIGYREVNKPATSILLNVLTSMDPEKWAPKYLHQHEHTGPGGKPIQHEHSETLNLDSAPLYLKELILQWMRGNEPDDQLKQEITTWCSNQ